MRRGNMLHSRVVSEAKKFLEIGRGGTAPDIIFVEDGNVPFLVRVINRRGKLARRVSIPRSWVKQLIEKDLEDLFSNSLTNEQLKSLVRGIRMRIETKLGLKPVDGSWDTVNGINVVLFSGLNGDRPAIVITEHGTLIASFSVFENGDIRKTDNIFGDCRSWEEALKKAEEEVKLAVDSGINRESMYVHEIFPDKLHGIY